MALRSVFLALVLATYPAQALDLKKELERLRGGADDKGTQTHATRGRAAPADASRLAPQVSRLGAIVKPTDPDAFECNPFKHKKTCFEGQRKYRKEGFVCGPGLFLDNRKGCQSCPPGDDYGDDFSGQQFCVFSDLIADFESAVDCLGSCFPYSFGSKKGKILGACTSCGLSDDADDVNNSWDCLTCEEGFEIIPMYSDCTGICVKSGRSVRTFKGMGFADLATSACTAFLDCYGGDERKAIKVLPTDGTNSFPWDVSYSYLYWSFSYDFESYSYGGDDEYDDTFDRADGEAFCEESGFDDEASCTAYGECCVWDKSACYYNAEDDDWLTGSKLHKDCPRN